MKKILLFFALSLFTVQLLHAQKIPADSIAVAGLKDSLKNISNSISQLKLSIPVKDSTCDCNNDGVVTGAENWLLVSTPVLLFLILVILLLFGKGLMSFDFKGALAENEMPKHSIINPEYKKPDNAEGGISSILKSVIAGTTEKNISNINVNEIVPPILEVTIIPPATEAKDNYRPSISRYIAFFSGMLTVIIAVCMASFFIYHYIRTSCPPDLTALSTVLIALGIGVAPYAINKISSAIAARKTDE